MKEDWSCSEALKFNRLIKKKLKLDVVKRGKEEALENVKKVWNETRSEIVQIMLDSGEDKITDDKVSVWIYPKLKCEVFDWEQVPESYIVNTAKIDNVKLFHDLKNKRCKKVPGVNTTIKPILYVKKKRRREDK